MSFMKVPVQLTISIPTQIVSMGSDICCQATGNANIVLRNFTTKTNNSRKINVKTKIPSVLLH